MRMEGIGHPEKHGRLELRVDSDGGEGLGPEELLKARIVVEAARRGHRQDDSFAF